MTEYVADTHALIWLLSDPSRLGKNARDVFEVAGTERAQIFVSTISLVEIQFKEDKHDASFPPGITRRIRDFVVATVGFAPAPLDVSVADAIAHIARARVPDMPDRVIAATALARSASLLTCDAKLTEWAGVPIVW